MQVNIREWNGRNRLMTLFSCPIIETTPETPPSAQVDFDGSTYLHDSHIVVGFGIEGLRLTPVRKYMITIVLSRDDLIDLLDRSDGLNLQQANG